MEIHINTIDNALQRYSTIGDYYYDSEGILQIKVSNLGDKKMEMLVIIHELVEEFLTRESGIKEEDISDFDKYYEKRREMGLVDKLSEPGFSSESPYRNQHAIATGIELIIAGILGVDWKRYEEIVNSL